MTTHEPPKKRYWTHTGRDVGTRPYPIPASDEYVQTNVAIETADGIKLRGDLYVPSRKGPFPAIVEITPYGCQSMAHIGTVYASRGYLFLAVDCRGRYRSEGEWEPLSFDRRDGHDVLGWISRHELCNGRVGTRGHSYSGYNQLLAAADAPACLQAMVVGVSPGDPFHNTPFQGGCYDLNDLFWLFDMTGRVTSDHDELQKGDATHPDLEASDESDASTDSSDDVEHDELLEAALTRRPFCDADLRLGIFHPTFRQWISHWRFDQFWSDRSVLPGIAKISAPTLHISGWWDGNGRGSTQFFEAMRQGAKTEHARASQRLLIGPWNHDLEAPDCEALPKAERLLIERGAQRDSLNDELAWFDEHLKDLPSSAACGARVTLYLTGLNKWMSFSDWPIPESRETPFYLDGRARPGELSDDIPAETRQQSYTLDPKDPTPFASAEVDAERMPFDNARIQSERDDLLLFETAPFEGPRYAVGPVKARVFASSDCRDFDLVASLYDVYPDGRSIFLTDGVMRARFRGGFDAPKLLDPGATYELTVDLWHLAHVFRPGHRLRLQISSAAHLRFDVNPCTGGDLATETHSKPVVINVFQGRKHPSCLILHLLDPSGDL